MHILITVFYNAQHGGLHNNIYSTIKYLLSYGHKVSVLCKPGPFANILTKNGVNVFMTDFENLEEDVKLLTSNEYKFDIIHAHPFASRKVAIEVSKILDIPLFITYHGMYIDEIAINVKYSNMIFTVSEALSDHLKKFLPDNQGRELFSVLTNGVNLCLYKPIESEGFFKRRKLLKYKSEQSKFNLTFVSRLDQDKEFIIDRFFEGLNFTNKNYPNEVKWTIVGNGTLLPDIQSKVTALTQHTGHQVDFIGWKEESELPFYYQTSDAVIAPGRCALEGMACGKPVIAIGSKAYIGLITHENWKKGVYTNFGGYGNKSAEYIEGTIGNDIKKIIDNPEAKKTLGDLGLFIIKNYYDENKINQRILEYFTLAIEEKKSLINSNSIL